MELIRGRHNLRAEHRGCVLAIGNFDGVHLGHQAVLEQLAQLGGELRRPTLVMLFEPQPKEFLQPDAAPARLTRLREKLQLLATTKLDRVLCIRFDRAFSRLEPEQFIDRLLVEQLGIAALVVGDDFRFGYRGAGDVETLHQAGRRHGFTVLDCARHSVDGRRVSSSWVRQALASGDLGLTRRLLGRPYQLCGRVAFGDQRGRTIGFPTANLALHRRRPPLTGVYAVRVWGIGHEALAGVANIGRRPTVAGNELRLEVHLFDFNDDIYGRQISVEIVDKIRDEQRFASFDLLRQQIARDAAAARAHLAVTSQA